MTLSHIQLGNSEGELTQFQKEGITNMVKVWIDQDLCTGDGLCAEIAPDVFFGMDDGLYYVKEATENFGAEKLFDGTAHPAGSEGMARVPDGGLDRVIESAEECPGECIFIDVE